MFKSLTETYRLNKLSFIFSDGVVRGVGVGTVLGPPGPHRTQSPPLQRRRDPEGMQGTW